VQILRQSSLNAYAENTSRKVYVVTILQTPATRPSESEPTGDSDKLVKVAEPFTIPFDKLIIAVGAYSQSMHSD
jgi:hypothetical protein